MVSQAHDLDLTPDKCFNLNELVNALHGANEGSVDGRQVSRKPQLWLKSQVSLNCGQNVKLAAITAKKVKLAAIEFFS